MPQSHTDTASELLTQRQDMFDIRLPDLSKTVSQDTEWCEVKLDDQWRRFRFHDYHEIYQVPGLYECLFYRMLKCNSPWRVVSELETELREHRTPPESLRVLDLGAGNGMVGAALHHMGVRSCVGVDIIPEAREAALRDRPWVYDDYFVADFTDLNEPTDEKLRDLRLNCLTVVAALGFADIPPRALLTALDLLDTPAWLALNVKENFLDPQDDSGFAQLFQQLIASKVIQIQSYRRVRHRVATTGKPLYYIALIATKQHDVPDHLLSA